MYRDPIALAKYIGAYFHAIRNGVDGLLKLPAYTFLESYLIPYWCYYVLTRRDLPAIITKAGLQVLSEWEYHPKYCFEVARKVSSAPWLSPEEHSRRAYKAGQDFDIDIDGGPNPESTIRVKWYPNKAAVSNWPAGLGPLYIDLPLDVDKTLDLTPLKDEWGMENCYVLLVGPGRRVRVGREPDEILSPIAWTVALDGHPYLHVIERPERSMQAARRVRRMVKRLCLIDTDTDDVKYGLEHYVVPPFTLPLWMAATLLALLAVMLWRLITPFVRCADPRHGASFAQGVCGARGMAPTRQIGQWLTWVATGPPAWVIVFLEALLFGEAEVVAFGEDAEPDPPESEDVGESDRADAHSSLHGAED